MTRIETGGCSGYEPGGVPTEPPSWGSAERRHISIGNECSNQLRRDAADVLTYTTQQVLALGWRGCPSWREISATQSHVGVDVALRVVVEMEERLVPKVEVGAIAVPTRNVTSAPMVRSASINSACVIPPPSTSVA